MCGGRCACSRIRLVECEIVDGMSRETVRRTLKNDLKPWLKQCWCIPPKSDAQFACAMEDILDMYPRAYPAVCAAGFVGQGKFRMINKRYRVKLTAESMLELKVLTTTERVATSINTHVIVY